MLVIFNGFRVHMALLPEMAHSSNNKILYLKEEGDSSHMNQVYDKCVANYDKVAKYESLAMLSITTSILGGPARI